MSERIEYIDNIKGIAILAVIMSHLFIKMSGGNCMLSFVTAWDVPLFFMASGFFTRSIAKSGFQELLIKKARTLLLPFVSFALISPFFLGWDTASDYWQQTGKGGLWFLPCLFVVFIALWGICRTASVSMFAKHDIITKLLFAVIVELFLLACHQLFPATWIGPSGIIPLALYWPYFFIGHCMGAYNFQIKDYVAALCGVIFFAWWGGDSYGVRYESFDQLARLCSVLFVWYVIKNNTSLKIKGISTIGKNTLCIYILHYFFKNGLGPWIEMRSDGNDFLEFLGALFFAFALSYLCIIIKRILSSSSWLSFILFGERIK